MAKKKWIILICIILSGSYIWFNFSDLAEPMPPGSISEQLLNQEKLEIASFDITLTDATRRTAANGDYNGDPHRTLNTTIRHPKNLNNKAYPLVIHSHGYSSMRDGGAYIAEHLASLGYIVAAADFPLTNYGAPSGPQVKDVINQPADISFIIDSLINMSQDDKHILFGAIDIQKIGVMGISLGGMTSTMATYDPNRRDSRIKAAVSIAGPSSMYSKRFFSSTAIPFMMMATPQDALVHYGDNAAPILKKASNAILLTLKEASHTGFADIARNLRWMDNPDAIGCFVVMQSLETEEEPWFHLLGSKEDGIIDNIKPKLCQQDPLPLAMNPLRQHQLTILAIGSFFQSQFAHNETMRAKHQQYLLKTMEEELSDITVTHNLGNHREAGNKQ